MNVAGVFLDNAARLARAHRASSARTTHCSYIRRPSHSRRLKLVLMWTKMGVHVPPTIPTPQTLTSLPAQIHSRRLDQLRSRLYSESPSLWQTRAPPKSASHQFHVSATYRPVIYRARANIQLKEGSGFGWKAG